MRQYPKLQVPSDEKLRMLLRHPQLAGPDEVLPPVEALPDDEKTITLLRETFVLAQGHYGLVIPASGRGQPQQAWQEDAVFCFIKFWLEATDKAVKLWESDGCSDDTTFFVQAAFHAGGLGVIPLSTIRDWASRGPFLGKNADIIGYEPS